jgi:hypothetical protein
MGDRATEEARHAELEQLVSEMGIDDVRLSFDPERTDKRWCVTVTRSRKTRWRGVRGGMDYREAAVTDNRFDDPKAAADFIRALFDVPVIEAWWLRGAAHEG